MIEDGCMIEVKGLYKEFPLNGQMQEVLKDVNLRIYKGEVFGIIGVSGAGKSTLVRCMNFLEKPTKGEILIKGKNLSDLNPKELREVRRNMGMIFQQFQLLEQRNAIDNICFPMELVGIKRKDARTKARELLKTVGMEEKERSFPSQLSGGQKQRVAIARALALNPEILLCDEATSALDPETTKSILELIRELKSRLGLTVVIITHEPDVVKAICDRVVSIKNGVVSESEIPTDSFEN
jgi:D-methionine transport system ATP-binding protein